MKQKLLPLPAKAPGRLSTLMARCPPTAEQVRADPLLMAAFASQTAPKRRT